MYTKEIGPHCLAIMEREDGSEIIAVFANHTSCSVEGLSEEDALGLFRPTEQGMQLAMVAAKAISLLRMIEPTEVEG